MKLNLGSGRSILPGYVNVDRCYERITDYPQGTTTINGEVFPLGYADNTCDEIRASHVLEHIGFRSTMAVIEEWVRVLQPGGILKIAVPDFEWIARRYVGMITPGCDHADFEHVADNSSAGIYTDWCPQCGATRWVSEDDPWQYPFRFVRHEADVNVTGYLMGGQTYADNFHKAIFDRRGLTAAMEAAGLVGVCEWTSDADDCSALEVSLNLQGMKPVPADVAWPKPDADVHPSEPDATPVSETEAIEQELPADTILFQPEKVGCVLSVPRLGFMSNMQCLLTVANLGIQVQTVQGAFWGQTLTEGMLGFMDAGKEFVLTVDYDTIFTADDVLTLYQYMNSPSGASIDALTAVQVRREKEHVLMSMANADGSPRTEILRTEMLQDVVKIRSAHFGLTMFRVSALQRMPHPWFLDVPDAEGKWGPGKRDCDINFWVRFGECGNSLYMANRVSVGHLELVCSWPNGSLAAQTQRLSEYSKSGKPAWAWK